MPPGPWAKQLPSIWQERPLERLLAPAWKQPQDWAPPPERECSLHQLPCDFTFWLSETHKPAQRPSRGRFLQLLRGGVNPGPWAPIVAGTYSHRDKDSSPIPPALPPA